MPNTAVFTDPSGRRWRGVRRGGLVAGLVTTLLALVIVAGVLAPPLLPAVSAALGDPALGDPALGAPLSRPRLVTAQVERARLAARQRLLAALGTPTAPDHPPRAAGRAATRAASRAATRAAERRARGAHATPVAAAGAPVVAAASAPTAASPEPAALPIVAGFHVNWDDNSLAALRAHAASLDWVVSEAVFVDSAAPVLRPQVSAKLLRTLAAVPDSQRPRLLLMVSNYAHGRSAFAAGPVGRLLAEPAARAAAVDTLVAAVRAAGAGGVVFDFEGLPARDLPGLTRLTDTVRAALRALPRPAAAPAPVVGVAVAADAPAAELAALARATDYVIAMLYDEHDDGGDPGPVASQRWFDAQARRAAAAVPARQLVLAVGNYGYDWNDGDGRVAGDSYDFQDLMRVARERGAAVRFDTASRNPYLAWSDPDSTDHVAWFLDGVTGAEQARTAARLGAAGVAVWRLGAEDPSLWAALDTLGTLPPRATALEAGRRAAAALARVPGGYDTEFDGTGEILTITARPTPGERAVTVDSATGALAAERVTRLGTPWVVRRSGSAAPHRVALTFDDGPDGRYTPEILDTLRARGVPATFFVVGRSAEGHLPLLRRIVAEGHELGNHSFTHPDLSRVSPFVTRLELDATERLIEAATARRTALFRAPYFGDAAPSTADELEPAWVAKQLGYAIVGLNIDTEDWQAGSTADSVVARALAARDRGNVVLLHDGGGDRAATVAAVGPLVDSLRARGDTLVLVSALVGVSRDQAMPPLPPSSAAVRYAELAAFGAVGALEYGLEWLFGAAVVLGLGRLVFVLGLAAWQRRQSDRARRAADAAAALGAAPYAPSVSVLVPAYNEGKVVAATVDSLLRQDYPGDLEIVVVDDGSTDDTYAVTAAAFADHPRVRVFRKPNGGKASALNFALAHARGDVVIGLDADTVFAPDCTRELVQPLADPRVGAVAGNAKVGNRVNLLTRWQAVEYVTSQNLDRRAFALLDGITVVPGAVGAWRADAVRAAGGFTHDTLAEDQDLTLRLRRAGRRIAYADRALAWTEAPETWGGFVKQRFRWSFGTLQCAWKHRDALFRRRYGTLGWVALPNVWLFQLLFTALSPLADLMFVWSLVSVWLAGQQHGASYALVDLRQVVVLYAVFLAVDWAAALLGFALEPGEDRRLAFLVVLQRFAYRQVMYAVVVKAFVAALRGRQHGWGKLDRTARVLGAFPAGERPAARLATDAAGGAA